MTTKSGSCLCITVASAAPSMDSSPTDADTITAPDSRARSRPAAAYTMAARAPFMSEEPRPQMRPSCCAPLNGSRDQALSGSTSTVSMWASSSSAGPSCRPRTAPTTLPASSIAT